MKYTRVFFSVDFSTKSQQARFAELLKLEIKSMVRSHKNKQWSQYV